MEPESTALAGSKKKILIIALVVILAVAGVALGYFFMQKDTPGSTITAPVVVDSQIVTQLRIYTDAEKRQALEGFAKQNSTSTTVSEAEKLRALKNYSTQTQAPVLSEDEKKKALEDFAALTKLAQ